MENYINYENNKLKAFMLAIKLLGIILIDVLVVFLVTYFFDVENFFTNGGLNNLKSQAITIRFSIIISIWTTLLIVNFIKAKKNGIFNVTFRFKKSLLLCIPLAILFPLLFTYKFNIGNIHFTVIDKFNFFLNKASGNHLEATVNTILQYTYWFVEMLIVILIIDAFHTVGNQFKYIKVIPWGGIGLAFTWGLEQLLMRPNTFYHIFMMSLFGGILYKLSKRNFYVVLVYFIVSILIKG